MAGRHDCRPAVFDSIRLLPIRNRNCDQRQQLEQRQRPYARRLPPGSSQMPHAAGRMIASAATLRLSRPPAPLLCRLRSRCASYQYCRELPHDAFKKEGKREKVACSRRSRNDA